MKSETSNLKSRICLITAVAENGVIGVDGDLPWRLPDELKYFKQVTTGHVLVMGRGTFESFGRPLPNRRNIIISRNADYHQPGVEVVHSLDQALELASDAPKIFIAGGESIYRLALPLADRLYLTRIHASPQGDRHFPAFDPDQWELIEECRHEADDRHAFAFTFKVYDRRHNSDSHNSV